MKTLNEPAPILESSDRRKRFTEVRQSFRLLQLLHGKSVLQQSASVSV